MMQKIKYLRLSMQGTLSIQIGYNILISRKLQYLVALWPWKCKISYMLQ